MEFYYAVPRRSTNNGKYFISINTITGVSNISNN